MCSAAETPCDPGLVEPLLPSLHLTVPTGEPPPRVPPKPCINPKQARHLCWRGAGWRVARTHSLSHSPRRLGAVGLCFGFSRRLTASFQPGSASKPNSPIYFGCGAHDGQIRSSWGVAAAAAAASPWFPADPAQRLTTYKQEAVNRWRRFLRCVF